MERLGEIEFAVHRACSHVGDALADAGRVAELVDDLLVDERGIHIHHEQSGCAKCGHIVKDLQRLYAHAFDCRKTLGQSNHALFRYPCTDTR